MSNNVLPGQVAVFSVVGVDTSGTEQPVTGSVKISDYVNAYMAGTSNVSEYMLVPKTVIPPGQSVTINCDFSATASDGTKLSTFSVSFVLVGATAPPPAVQLILKSAVSVDKSTVTVPSDPGGDTININSGGAVTPPPPPPPPPPA